MEKPVSIEEREIAVQLSRIAEATKDTFEPSARYIATIAESAVKLSQINKNQLLAIEKAAKSFSGAEYSLRILQTQLQNLYSGYNETIKSNYERNDIRKYKEFEDLIDGYSRNAMILSKKVREINSAVENNIAFYSRIDDDSLKAIRLAAQSVKDFSKRARQSNSLMQQISVRMTISAESSMGSALVKAAREVRKATSKIAVDPSFYVQAQTLDWLSTLANSVNLLYANSGLSVAAALSGKIWSHYDDRSVRPLTEVDSREDISEEQKIVIVHDVPKILEDLKNDINIIYKLSAEQFENFVCERLVAMGYGVEKTGKTYERDGGVDIIAWPKCLQGLKFLIAVQAKHSGKSTRKIGPQPVKDLTCTVSGSKDFVFGILVTNVWFTPHAEYFAEREKKIIRLRNFGHLKRWIMNDFTGDPELREVPNRIPLTKDKYIDLPWGGINLEYQ